MKTVTLIKAHAVGKSEALLDGTQLATPARQGVVPEMVREAEAHCPFGLLSTERWQWTAEYLNKAIANPNDPCPCCNVTPDGDILDHLPLPAAGNRDAAPAAVERCESGSASCGPVEYWDIEGVPLCSRCWNSLDPIREVQPNG